mgnify:CR=1 FL=1
MAMGCGASQPTKPVDGEQRLQEAAETGDFSKVQQLLMAGVPAETRSKGMGWSPLHTAAARGHNEIAKILFQYGAVLELRETFGDSTPRGGFQRDVLQR